MAAVIAPAVYRAHHPDWRVTQQRAVEEASTTQNVHVWVAETGGETAGFVALRRHDEERVEEITMIAVDPAFQRQGIAARLAKRALTWFKESGMMTVMVETGGDPGRVPACRTDESAGFRPLPIVRYFKKT